MKIKDTFVLRQIAQNWIIFALEHKDASASGVLKLNRSGVLLWQRLEKGCSVDDLVQALMDEYGLPLQQAQVDAIEFVEILRAAGCIEE